MAVTLLVVQGSPEQEGTTLVALGSLVMSEAMLVALAVLETASVVQGSLE